MECHYYQHVNLSRKLIAEGNIFPFLFMLQEIETVIVRIHLDIAFQGSKIYKQRCADKLTIYISTLAPIHVHYHYTLYNNLNKKNYLRNICGINLSNYVKYIIV